MLFVHMPNDIVNNVNILTLVYEIEYIRIRKQWDIIYRKHYSIGV